MMKGQKTQKQMFGEVREILMQYGTEEQVKFIEGRIELLDKKTENKKMSSTQVQNEGLKNIIVNILANSEKALTINELQSLDARLQEVDGKTISNQKMSALLTQLVDNNIIARGKDKKGKALFSIVK